MPFDASVLLESPPPAPSPTGGAHLETYRHGARGVETHQALFPTRPFYAIARGCRVAEISGRSSLQQGNSRARRARSWTGKWFDSLPKVPLTRKEVRLLKRRQMDRGGLLAPRQLRVSGAEAAGIIAVLRLSSGVRKEASSVLREDRTAQITPATAISSTRLGPFYKGRQIPTVRGQCRLERDSFGHLLRCYR